MALALMRSHRRWLYIFLWLVIAAFIILYIPALTTKGQGMPGETVVNVGGLPVSVGEFQRTYYRQRQMYDRLYQGRLDENTLRRLGLEEQVLEGGGGEHDPQGRDPGGDRRGDRRLRTTPKQDDRPLRGGEECRFGVVDRGQPPGRLEITDHQCQRLFLTALVQAQAPHGLVVSAVDGQVKSAEPLEGENRAPAEHPDGPSDGIISFEQPALTV